MSDKKQELKNEIEAIKDCPCCDDQASLIAKDREPHSWIIKCENFLCEVGLTDSHYFKKDAIKVWNTRPESIPISELEGLIEKYEKNRFYSTEELIVDLQELTKEDKPNDR